MNHARKFYLISPALYDRVMLNKLNSSGSEPNDIQLKKFTQSVGEEKILDRNQKDQSWKMLGDRLQALAPMRKTGPGFVTAPASVSPGVPTTPSSPPSAAPIINESVKMVELLESKLPKYLINRGVKLYFALKELSGVNIDAQNILVDGVPLTGGSLGIIDNLIRSVKTLKYPIEALLDKIRDAPNRAGLFSLVSNKEAKIILNREDSDISDIITDTPEALPGDQPFPEESPKASSTPVRSRPVKSETEQVKSILGPRTVQIKNRTRPTSGEDTFFSGLDESTLTKKGSGLIKLKRPWISLFSKHGKQNGKQNGRGKQRFGRGKPNRKR